LNRKSIPLFRGTVPGVLLLVALFGCDRSGDCGDCENGTLFYTPNCASIEGYVVMESTGRLLVFQHGLPPAYVRSGMPVCIKYDNKGSRMLFADCAQGDVIEIKCIRAQ
jgi:hypothetical protein